MVAGGIPDHDAAVGAGASQPTTIALPGQAKATACMCSGGLAQPRRHHRLHGRHDGCVLWSALILRSARMSSLIHRLHIEHGRPVLAVQLSDIALHHVLSRHAACAVLTVKAVELGLARQSALLRVQSPDCLAEGLPENLTLTCGVHSICTSVQQPVQVAEELPSQHLCLPVTTQQPSNPPVALSCCRRCRLLRRLRWHHPWRTAGLLGPVTERPRLSE